MVLVVSVVPVDDTELGVLVVGAVLELLAGFTVLNLPADNTISNLPAGDTCCLVVCWQPPLYNITVCPNIIVVS